MLPSLEFALKPDLLRPGEDASPLWDMSFPGAILPGPVEDSTRLAEDQEHGRRKRSTRRPRTRGCLLKGCEQRFHPLDARRAIAVRGAGERRGNGRGGRRPGETFQGASNHLRTTRVQRRPASC